MGLMEVGASKLATAKRLNWATKSNGSSLKVELARSGLVDNDHDERRIRSADIIHIHYAG